MIKRILLCILMCSLASISFAQSLADINSPQILPPAPEAAALGKYGQIPVDKSTGIPNISIPLYQIKTSRFTLPIFLSYHASGIKVSEYSTWVGAGWSLNAGGVITRTILGMPDDHGGFLSSKGKSVNTLMNMCNQAPNTIASVSALSTPPVVLDGAATGQADYQPDNFFYNFGDKSGAFVFGPDSLRTPVLIPYKPLKITYNKIALDTLTITDESGNIYVFADQETVNHQISSWYLSKMISADHSDVISFTYQTDQLGGYEETFPNFVQTYTASVPPSYGNPPSYGAWPQAPVGPISQPNTFQQVSYDKPLYIRTITFNGGKVDFIPKGGRLESTNNYGGPDISLDSVIVSTKDYNQTKFTRLKSFKINTGYWTNNMTIYNTYPASYSGSIYRLKLDSVVENDKNNVAVKTHKFGYDPTILPPMNYYAQDHWGYYNAQNQNISLLQKQTAVDFSNNFYIAGDANRNINVAAMKAGMLEQITYPTKGYTVFTYEPHQFLKYSTGILPQRTASTSSAGVAAPTTTTNFTTDYLPGLQTYAASITVTFNQSSSPTAPNVKLINVGTGAVVFQQTYNSSYNWPRTFGFHLDASQQYQLYSNSPGPTNTTTASITITYDVNAADSANVVAYGGGVRINSIKNYNADGTILSTERYKYGTTENGTGVLMNGNLAFIDTTSRVNWLIKQINTSNGVVYQAGWNVIKTYSSNPTYSLSTLSGSPVGYGAVTVYHGDTVNNIGKSRYEYINYPDSVVHVGGTYQNGIMLDPVSWKNGQVAHEAHYRNIGSGSYALEQEKYNTYLNLARTPAMGIYVRYMFEVGPYFSNPKWLLPGYCLYPAPGGGTEFTTYPNGAMYDYFSYPISTGSAVPSQTISINYANDGVTKLTQDTVKYFYDNHTHLYPTRIVSYDGKGDSLLKTMSYPQDMPQTGIYGTMTAANMISPVIKFTQSKNGSNLMQSITNYSNSNPNSIINPQNVSLQVFPHAAETRVNYLYDFYGNISTASKPSGAPVSYQWGYNGEYPVAEVKNASSNDIFYESFEDGHGNTGFGDAKTGRYSYLGPYSKSLSQLDPGHYRLSYWLKSGNVWSIDTATVTVSGTAYTINIGSSTTQVDDIRFYPVGALMTTYTYDPLVGVTSTTDTKGEITYYEYDSLQRLMNIRDQYNNIVKSFCYNYAGQTTNCFINQPSYSSAPRDSVFTRNCGAGYTGSAVHYILPAGAFISNVSQQDANNQAKNDVIANGQNYANLNGTCTQNTVGFTMTNTSGASGLQVTFYGATNLYYTVPSSGSLTVQVPPGTYSSVSVGVGNGPPHTYTLGTRTPVTNSIAGWSNVVIATGSSDLTLTVQ